MGARQSATPSHDSKPGGKILSFEGLRGILALVVCCGHVGLNTLAAKAGLHIRFELAVDVFFALSGFVLSRAYYFGRRSFGDLLGGRIARLYPLHLLTLCWCAAVLPKQPEAWALFLQSAGLVHNIGLPPNTFGYNFPSWSISVEMVASLAFFFILRRRTGALAPVLIGAGLALAALDAAGALEVAANHFGVVNSGLVRGASGFCIGAAAFLVVSRVSPAWLPQMGRVAGVMPVMLIPFFLQASWSPLMAALFALAILVVLIAAASNDRTVLAQRLPVQLGAMSYSVYLLHIPILLTAMRLFGENGVRGLVPKLALLGTVLLASLAMHRWFELPMQRRVLTWIGKMQG